ncbi:MAG: protein kinase [Gammaproteobacteria bacterium]|nr:protein kinase [Gammaproteobacteria bacterium]MDH4314844.1 protein kinase [Gammaproteobacteria bacterium]MDH5214647.1 protein kinase [Gammaproteobacteria bacterium]
MSIGSEKVKLYHEQLAALEQRLQAQIDDESTLHDIQRAFETLLAGSGEAEKDIRMVLQRQFSNGQLRKETFELVRQILNRIVSENLATEPGATIAEPDSSSPDSNSPDSFSDTTIIPSDTFIPIPAEERLQVGSVLRDRFLLQEKVAGGSMGAVYKALDRRLAEVGSESSFVAIKVLAPKLSRNGNALRALQQEAAKGRCLSHPNIVRFIDLDRDDDLYFIVMEWLDGRSLADILDDGRNSKIDSATAFDIVRQIGQALDYAHRCGVVHADVKPGNIMITPSGQAKLFDFGVARIRQKQHSSQADFDAGVMNAATPIYSSMQVLTGEDPVPADDVFSLGCLLYRLLAGYRAFGPRNAAEAAEAGMEPQRLQGISQVQWSALKKSLAYSRVSRYPSVADFLKALDGDSKPLTETQTLPDVIETSRGTSLWRIVIPILALVVGGVIAQQLGLVDQFLGSRVINTEPVAIVPSETQSEFSGLQTDQPEFIEAETGVATPVEPDISDVVNEIADTSQVEATPPGEIDFSQLPPARLVVSLGMPGSKAVEAGLELIEDGDGAIIDFIRSANVALPLTLRLEEASYSGNRSPWESGQYRMQDNGQIRFAAGQSRARTMITMASDPLREPDRDVVLRVRDADYPDSDFALLRLNLMDDDQRRFEAGLKPNTVAFAVSQVSVRERDPAVQIDVLRFKPDASNLDVAYFVRDVTATEGEDYFAPPTGTVSFGPGQRTARIFIPLVQDVLKETDEAFMLELDPSIRDDDANIFVRIAVMIRDDDS